MGIFDKEGININLFFRYLIAINKHKLDVVEEDFCKGALGVLARKGFHRAPELGKSFLEKVAPYKRSCAARSFTYNYTPLSSKIQISVNSYQGIGA